MFGPLDPLGLTATSFKVPTRAELRHDFLWRVHAAAPAGARSASSIGRTTRTCSSCGCGELVPESVWRPRYDQINQFERILSENGTVILKFMLHISREEQRERLSARLEDPEKYWKFNAGDLKERELWDGYTEAYREMLARTSTEVAPWYVVPADSKRVRDLLVARTVADTLERMDPRYPGPPPELAALRGRAGGLAARSPVRPHDHEGERPAHDEEGALPPRLSCSAFMRRALVELTTTPSCIDPVVPPFAGTKLSQSSRYSDFENENPTGR